jgi:hypothetical protein
LLFEQCIEKVSVGIHLFYCLGGGGGGGNGGDSGAGAVAVVQPVERHNSCENNSIVLGNPVVSQLLKNSLLFT